MKFGPKHLGLILATCSADGTVRIYEVIYCGVWRVCLIDTSLFTKYNKLLDMVFFQRFMFLAELSEVQFSLVTPSRNI